MEKSSSSHTHVPAGKHQDTIDVINRLSRIEGHIRAIKSMLEEGRSCSDVLIQLAAVKSAIRKAAQAVLEDHIESCWGHAATDRENDQEWRSLREALHQYFD